MSDVEGPAPGPQPLEITDVLDLHSFPPQETADLVRHWLDEVAARGLRELRIIHGRGAGVQREMVRSLLRRDPRVISFGDAPEAGGGWGATCVTLR
jgi:dsDNA-specific endonuclease/ATPase MutS2